MEYHYTIDANAEEPIMLIDKHIGYDTEDGEGIMGDKFCRELMFLDTLNKSKINVWINSPGGVITDAEQIVAAILKSKTKVDTYNIGMAASCAGPIFLAGRNRYMMDYAKFMMHPVSGGDTKSRTAFENSTVTMLTARSLMDEKNVRQMMNVTTWLSAAQCEEMGLCRVENSGSLNRPYMAEYNNYKDFKSVVNSLIEKQKPVTMSKVTNKLKLVDGSNEDAQVQAIEAIENRASAAENKVVKMQAELDEALKNKATAEENLKTANDKLAAEKLAKDKAEKDKAEAEAENEITNAVKIGKIKNDAGVIKTWSENYLNNPAGTKAMIDALPLNKAGAKIPAVNGGGAGASDAKLESAMAIHMAEVRNKFKI